MCVTGIVPRSFHKIEIQKLPGCFAVVLFGICFNIFNKVQTYHCSEDTDQSAICSLSTEQSVFAYSLTANITINPVLSGHSKRRPKIGSQDRLLLNAGQKYCRMLQMSIPHYFRPSLSYHLSFRHFCLFLSGR